MESSVDEEEHKRTGRDLFKKKVPKNYFLNHNSSGSDEESDEESEEDENAHEQNVFNQQNAFGMQVFSQKAVPKKAYARGGFGGFNFGAPTYQA